MRSTLLLVLVTPLFGLSRQSPAEQPVSPIERAALCSQGFRSELHGTLSAKLLSDQQIAAAFSNAVESFHTTNAPAAAAVLHASLYLMQKRKTPWFAKAITSAMGDPGVPVAVRKKILKVVYGVTSDENYLLSFLDGNDDPLRAAALEALVIAQPESAEQLIKRAKSTRDTCGRHTWEAISHIESMRDAMSLYRTKVAFADRLAFLMNLLTGLSMNPEMPPRLPDIDDNVYAQYLLSQFRELYKNDPTALRSALLEENGSDWYRRGVAKTLLLELESGE